MTEIGKAQWLTTKPFFVLLLHNTHCPRQTASPVVLGVVCGK